MKEEWCYNPKKSGANEPNFIGAVSRLYLPITTLVPKTQCFIDLILTPYEYNLSIFELNLKLY